MMGHDAVALRRFVPRQATWDLSDMALICEGLTHKFEGANSREMLCNFLK
jgi:hypothetical protein